MRATFIQGFVRGGCFLLLLCLPVKTALALVVAGSTLGISNLQIIPAAGSVVFFGPSDVSAIVSSAFNSLGEADSNGEFGTGIDVSTDATVSFATGHAEASVGAGTLNVSSAINLGGNGNAAGVSSPGALGSLSFLFGFTGVSGLVDVTFSMDISSMLHAFADSLGSFDTDFDASLEVDGETILFSSGVLAGGPNFAATTQLNSQTLSATVPLDSTLSYFLIMTSHVDTEGSNEVPEPGTLVLALVALALLPICSPTRGGQPHNRSQPSRSV
ncbi:MAG: hypothetical protein V5B40_19940 [Candidatus Accumulibacter meliphilus]|jgi:hypothetical protein|uniref:hypothetical protein n=1 Tax=Candidatus Accumulibacter meliphilus TaxID=2211374 RepID=UPI002FC29538